MRFSAFEITELVKAWIVISLAFAILYVGPRLDFVIITALGISLFTVGFGFLLHELGHKYLAQKYRCWAEFRANNFMLGLALLMSFFGFLFAAPGGVLIRGHLSLRKFGMISLLGPLINLLLGVVFLVLAIFFSVSFAVDSQVLNVFVFGMQINFWLALFNMLPLWGLDGQKVLQWNKIVYGIVLALSVIGVFGATFLLH